jgi:hypothetical protein
MINQLSEADWARLGGGLRHGPGRREKKREKMTPLRRTVENRDRKNHINNKLQSVRRPHAGVKELGQLGSARLEAHLVVMCRQMTTQWSMEQQLVEEIGSWTRVRSIVSVGRMV